MSSDAQIQALPSRLSMRPIPKSLFALSSFQFHGPAGQGLGGREGPESRDIHTRQSSHDAAWETTPRMRRTGRVNCSTGFQVHCCCVPFRGLFPGSNDDVQSGCWSLLLCCMILCVGTWEKESLNMRNKMSTILWMWLSGPADLGVLGKRLCFFHLSGLILTLPGQCLLWVLLLSQEKPFSLVVFQPGDSCHKGKYGVGRVLWPLKDIPVANSRANARIFQYPQGVALLTCWLLNQVQVQLTTVVSTLGASEAPPRA